MVYLRNMSTDPTTTCFVCGYGPHGPLELHSFWSVADARREADEYDARAAVAYPSMTAAETLDPREAIR